jgi:hypothetical protein
MKKINLLLLLVLSFILIPGVLRAQTFDLQFIEELNNGTNFKVRVQIKASADFKLAASNITFNFNKDGLRNPILDTPYNFDGIVLIPPITFYGTMTVTNPNDGVASINIVFTAGDASVAGTVSSASWVDVATVAFTTTNSSLNSSLSFRSATPSPMNVYSCTGSGAGFTTALLGAGIWSTLDNPLPVELTSFAAKKFDEDKVKLNWRTQTEVNNYGFNVERKANSGQWEKVGFVNGNGNSNSPKEYSYIDNNLFGGSKFFYRLKQVDNDGQFEYSDLVKVEVIPNKFGLSQNYPNPFNPGTTIRFSIPEAGNVKLNVFNSLGEEVANLADEFREAGIYNINFDAKNLSSGMYIYRIEAGNFVQTRKMTLLK